MKQTREAANFFIKVILQENIITVRYYSWGYSSDSLPHTTLIPPLSPQREEIFLKNARGLEKKGPKDFRSNKLSVRVLFVLIVQKYKDCI